jgi:hypothetical protein
VDTGGRAVTWNGKTWSARVVDGDGGALTAVSCAGPRRCVAVDTSGRALVWTGRRWSPPRVVDPRGGGLTAVSCPTGGYCVATDFDGQIVPVGVTGPRR